VTQNLGTFGGVLPLCILTQLIAFLRFGLIVGLTSIIY